MSLESDVLELLAWKRYGESLTAGGLRFVPLAAPLTSTSWDGDAYSTTAKTLLDLSVVFGVPANVKAVDVRVAVRDSASAGATAFYGAVLSPNDTAGEGKFVRCAGVTNDAFVEGSFIVPCDGNGDVYYQLGASGAGTLDVFIQVWGYWEA